MASNSHRKSNSSDRSRGRKKVHIAAGPPRRDRLQNPHPKPKVNGNAEHVPARERHRAKAAGEAVSKSKRQQREQRLAGQRRQDQLRIGGAVLAAALIIFGAISLYNSSIFAVKRVEVVGNKRLTAAEVRSIARVPSSATLLRFPGRQVRSRLLASPWVSEAYVTRDFPDGLRIRIAERTPAARLDLGSTFWLIDRAGYVLAKADVEEASPMPVVRDVEGVQPSVGKTLRSDELENALGILEGVSPELRAYTRAVSAPSIDKTALYTTGGVEIFFGEATDLEKKDLVARRIMKEQKGKVVSINVRTVERPTWHGLGE